MSLLWKEQRIMIRKGTSALFWLLVVVVMLTSVFATGAQSVGPYVAFVNGSGQLVVTSGDGGYRWIVTNPGEYLNATLGYNWASDGRRLFYAVDAGTDISLRVADVSAQSAAEIGRVPPPVSGGQWTPDNRIVLSAGGQLVAYPAAGGSPAVIANAETVLRSPFDTSNERAHLPQASNVAPDGMFLFYGQPGANLIQPLGSAPYTVAGGDPPGQYNGLWADGAPLVAYTAMAGNSQLLVTNAATGATLTLDSGRTAPINPLAWRPGTTQLIYRDATNYARIADVVCLLSSCSDNPLQSGRELLPASASDVQTDGNWVYFVDGGGVQAVPLTCVDAGNCASSAIVLGQGVAPQSIMDVSGGTLAYTAGGGYGAGEVRTVDLTCLGNQPGCAPRTLATNAMNGTVAPGGQYVLVEGNGTLSALRVSDGQLAYLTDSAGGLLAKARWNG